MKIICIDNVERLGGRLVSKSTELFDTIEENRNKKLCQLDII